MCSRNLSSVSDEVLKKISLWLWQEMWERVAILKYAPSYLHKKRWLSRRKTLTKHNSETQSNLSNIPF
jgi:pyruvate-formate lyase-activating enzyme